MVSTMTDKEIGEAFSVIDLDGNGCINKDELRQVLTSISTADSGKFSGNQVHKVEPNYKIYSYL